MKFPIYYTNREHQMVKVCSENRRILISVIAGMVERKEQIFTKPGYTAVTMYDIDRDTQADPMDPKLFEDTELSIAYMRGGGNATAVGNITQRRTASA